MAIYGIVQSAQLDSLVVTTVLGTDRDRQCILFSAPPPGGSSSYTVSTDPGVTATAGIVLNSGSGAVEITRCKYGDAVTKPWYGVASSPMEIGVLVSTGTA